MASAAIAVDVPTRPGFVLAFATAACVVDDIASLGTSSVESTSVDVESTSVDVEDDVAMDGETSTSGGPTSTSLPAESGSTSSDATSSDATSGTSSTTASTESYGTSTGSSGTTGTPLGEESSSSGEAAEPEYYETPVCTELVARTHYGEVRPQVDGDRSVTLDDDRNLVLWDAPSLAVIYETHSVDAALLESGMLLYVVDEIAQVRNATTGEWIGEMPAGDHRGLAQGGGYVWVAGDDELRVHEPTGELQWSVAISDYNLRVLALEDEVHVHAQLESAQEVMHFAVSDGTVESDVFVGDFRGWFADQPRYWTTDDGVFRVYDTDGSEIATGDGSPARGWGSRLAFATRVVDLADPATSIATLVSPRWSRSKVLSRVDEDSANIVHLDRDPIEVEAVELAVTTSDYAWATSVDFAGDDAGWLVGAGWGVAVDHLGRSLTEGQVGALSGSASGRLLLSLFDAPVRIVDVQENCEWDVVSTIDTGGRYVSGDGSLMLTNASWAVGETLAKSGTRAYSLPDGQLLWQIHAGLYSDHARDYDTSHDGMVWSRTIHGSVGRECEVYGPGFEQLENFFCTSITRVSRDGAYYAKNLTWGALDYWAVSEVNLMGPDGLIAEHGGVAHGFVDDERVLVSRYDDAPGQPFLGSVLLKIDGTSVPTTVLPDIRSLQIVGDGEVVGVDRYGNAAIYDIDAESMIWEATPQAEIAAAGPNHVLVSTGARVDLVRWR